MAYRKKSVYSAFVNYRDALVRSLVRLSVKPEDVDDILQEALARSLEAENNNRVESPKNYLFAVSRNIVYRESQRRRREIVREVDEAIIESSAPAIEDDVHFRNMLDAFWSVLATLPAAQQRAILLRRVYGLSHKQIAKKMDVSVSSVEKYIAQGMRRCGDLLDRRGYSVDRKKEIRDVMSSGRQTTSVPFVKGNYDAS